MKSIYTKFFSTNALMTLLFLFASTFVFGQNGSSNLSAHVNHPEKGKIKLDGKPNSVEMIQKRTLNSRTFDNNDGTFSNVAANKPLHYEKNGVFYSYDNKIKINETGKCNSHKYVNDKNSFITYLPESIDQGFISEFESGDVISDMNSMTMYFESNGNNILNIDVNHSSAIISGAKAIYEEVYSNIDLVVTMKNNRRKADYVIKSNSFLNNVPLLANHLVFEENITIPNDWTVQLSENKVNFYNLSGQFVAGYDSPLISDNLPYYNIKDKKGLGITDYEAEYDIIVNGNNVKLLTKVKVNWLKSPERKFPLTIDPDMVDSWSGALLTGCGTLTGGATTVGAAAGSTIDQVSVQGVDNYWAPFAMECFSSTCGSYYGNGSPVDWYNLGWAEFKLTGSLGTSASNAGAYSGNDFRWDYLTEFDGQTPDQNWTFALNSLDGYSYYGRDWTLTVTVTYTEPSGDFLGVTESAGFSTCTSGSANDVTIDFVLSNIANATATPPSNISLSADGLIFAAPGDPLPLTASGMFYARLDGVNINEGEVFTDVITLSDDAGVATSFTIPTIAAGQLPVANLVSAGNDQTVCDGTAVTLTAAHATATSPACLTFGSSSDGINCGNSSALNLSGTEITIEAWIYPTSWRTNKWEGSIINNEDNNSGYMLRCGASGTLDFNWGDNSAWNDCSSSSGALTLNTWQHVAATYDGATIKLYVDGSLVASQADVFTGQSSDNNIMIGNSEYSPSRYFPGAIDEVRVWKHSRTARDIQALMNRDLAVVQIGSASGLIGYWNMNEGVGQAIEDLSGNGGDGSAVGVWNFVPPTELQNTFSWDNSVTDGAAFTPVSTTTYTATQTTNDGCTTSNTDAVDVTVNATPTVTLNSPSACSGLTATMTATPAGGSGVYSTYTWTVPAGESAPGNVASFDASTAGAYTVSVTSDGCTSTDAAGTFTDAGSTFTWDGSEGTSWSDVENWSCGAVPTSSTDVVIPDVTNQPVISSSATIASLTVSTGADITISSNTLTVSGASDIDGTVNIAAGATYDANGDMDATGGNITFTGAGSLKIGATLTSLGDLTTTVGTVEFDGGPLTIPADTYYDVSISQSNTKTIGGAVNINGDLSNTGTSTIAVGANTLTVVGTTDIDGTLTISTGTLDVNDIDVDGALTVTSTGRVEINDSNADLSTFTCGTGTVEYDYSSGGIPASETYYNLEIDGNNSTGAAMFAGDVTNDITVKAGSKLTIVPAVSLSTITVENTGILATGASITASGLIDIDGVIALNADVNADGEFDATGGEIQFPSSSASLILSSTVTGIGTLPNDAGTVKYDGTSDQDVVAPSSGGYYDLAIENASTKTATGNIDVDGTLTTEAEASCIFDLSTYDLNIAGNLTVGQEGGLDASDASCIVTFDGNSTVTHAGSQTISNVLTPNQELLNDGLSNLNNWTAEQHNSSTSWSVGDGSAYFSANSGGSCAWMQEGNYNYSEASITYDLPSPQTGMSVSFYYINPSWSGDIDWLDVDYYNGSTWTNIVRYDAGAASWTSVSSLAIPDGATKLRFYGLLGWGYGVGVDDVIITGDQDVLTSTSTNPTFNEIVVNGGDVTLADPVDVTSGLTLTSGDIISESDVNSNDSQTYASTNTITLKDGATVTGGSASSHVVGAVRGESSSTTEIEFPTGDGTNYRPAYLTPSASTATTYTVEYVNASHSSIAYDGNGYNNTPVGAGIDHVAMGCWWDIEKSSGGSDAFIAITWDENSGVNIPDDILLTHWNSSTSMWEDVPVATATLADATGAATASSGRIKSTSAQSDFSPWDLGSSTPDGGPLPVDLISFHTDCSHDIVDVNFSILSQVNNDKFLIERSTDAIDWEVVGEIPGVDGGFSNTQIDYVFTDNNPLANLSYYRLTQMDFDGKVETFYPVSNTCGGATGGLPIDVYPNPAWNEVTIEMELDNYQGDDVYYTITDAAGKAAMSDYIQLNRGFNKHTLDLNKLPQGVYILRFNQTKDHIIETRIVKR